MSNGNAIVPIYNVEPYLRRCLDSLVNQTLKDIEIICINDCSPDKSLIILKEYAGKDNRIKIIDFEKNQGVSVARNSGMKIAKGEYIGLLRSR
jgi:glycosyltransferase involved in cell wall biosynthesis